MLVGPYAHRLQHRKQVGPLFGQTVIEPHWIVLVAGSLNQAKRFESFQPVCQDVRRNVFGRLEELAKTRLAREQISDDYESPAIAGVNMVHVPYRGTGPALVDLLGGQMQVMFGSIVASIEYIRTGRLRALAVTSATRSNALPDIPSVSEFLPGYEANDWKGVLAPKDTPVEITSKLNEAINAALTDPQLKMRLADLGGIPLPGSTADFRNFIAAETEKWGKVIRAGNIKAE